MDFDGGSVGVTTWDDIAELTAAELNRIEAALVAGGGHTIEDEGSALTSRSSLNFVGAGVAAADAGGKTVVTIPGGSSVAGGAEYTLASSTAIGATTVTLDRAPTNLISGSVIAIGAMTNRCEMRQVLSVAGTTVNLRTNYPLNLTHTAGDRVWVHLSGDITPEWYGCVADDVTSDSHVGLQQAFNDYFPRLTDWGITGRGRTYYSSRPLCFPDYMSMSRIELSVGVGFAANVDPLRGVRVAGEPDQHFMSLAGQSGTVMAVNPTANSITVSSSPGGAGERIIFYPRPGYTLPAPLEAGRTYWVKTESSLVLTISEDYNGAVLDITDSGTGTVGSLSAGSFVWHSVGFARVRWTDVRLEGGFITGLNGLIGSFQQPARIAGLYIEHFPGPTGGLTMGTTQEVDITQMVILHCRVGMRMSHAQFVYIKDLNIEDCDTGVIFDNVGVIQPLTAPANNDIQFYGVHAEVTAVMTANVQTITGNASTSTGTFTLTFNGQTTSAIAYNATAATIETALEALSNIEPADIAVTQPGGLLSAGGKMVLTFAGQYKWAQVPNTTIGVGSLTGGAYTIGYSNPNTRFFSHRTGQAIGIWGCQCSGGDFYVLEAVADPLFSGFALHNITCTGADGLAVRNIPEGKDYSWTINVEGSLARSLSSFVKTSRRGGGTFHKGVWVVGDAGKGFSFESVAGELRMEGGALIRYGDTGPALQSGSGSPEWAVFGRIGSIYMDSTNGVLYVKKSGSGLTSSGWKLVTQAA